MRSKTHIKINTSIIKQKENKRHGNSSFHQQKPSNALHKKLSTLSTETNKPNAETTNPNPATIPNSLKSTQYEKNPHQNSTNPMKQRETLKFTATNSFN